MSDAAVLPSEGTGQEIWSHPAIRLALGVGAGVVAALAGAAAGALVGYALSFAGYGYASFASVALRVVVAAAFIAGGVALASLDMLPAAIGAGALVGAPLGAVFGAASLTGLAWALALGALAGLAGFGLGCTQIPPLTRREFNAYFFSPVAYVVAAVFLVLFGLFFYLGLTQPRDPEASIAGPIWFVTMYVLPVLTPALTMRLLAEEKRSGTLEVLMTAPVKDWEVVLSKFFAALATFGMMLVPTLVHVAALYLVSERGPAAAPMVGHYVGLVLTASLFLSLGLLGSSLSRDQIVAAIVGFGLTFGVFLLSLLEGFAQAGGWFEAGAAPASLMATLGAALKKVAEVVISSVSYFKHMERFSSGVIDTRSVFFFVSLTVFVLFLTIRVVESRKWR